MKIRRSGIRGADLRLCLAVAACFVLFVATPTTTDSNTCGASTGTVVVKNQSLTSVTVSFSGPQSISVTVDSEATASVTLKVGQYGWTAVAPQGAGSTAGSVAVKKGEAVTITISF